MKIVSRKCLKVCYDKDNRFVRDLSEINHKSIAGYDCRKETAKGGKSRPRVSRDACLSRRFTRLANFTVQVDFYDYVYFPLILLGINY